MLPREVIDEKKRWLIRNTSNGVERAQWHEIWNQALANMPAITNRGGTMGCWMGQQSALAHCLWGVKKKNDRTYNAHNSVYNGWLNGSKPAGAKAELLKQLAGPNGSELALQILTEMGIADRYNIWPHIVKSIGCFML